ncbi:MAG: hypothetical protein JEY94_05505 [Melioribacteraceae bacterium]|nr:hypothetical protein [Melioribacteraceae bacterium]
MFLEGEYISVMLDYDEEDIDKSFYYGLAGYNFNEDFFGYATYSTIKDQQVNFLKDGLKSIVIGAGYRPTFGIVIKAEYGNYFISEGTTIPLMIDPAIPPIDANIELDFTNISLAISVIF